jgi:hypothetical protein
MLAGVLAAAMSAGAAIAGAGGIVVDLNGSVRVPLTGTAANVVIANPSVVDVAMIDTHSVVVIGKGYGVTEILVTDHAGRTLMDRRVAVVGPEQARVTLFHGPQAIEFDCTSRCESLSATQEESVNNNAAAQQPQAAQAAPAQPVAAQPVQTQVQHAPM